MLLTNVRDLGLLIREARRNRGLSQAQLAESARVSRQWLALVETGRANPVMNKVLDILEVLNLALEVAEPPPASPGHRSLDDLIRLSRPGEL